MALIVSLNTRIANLRLGVIQQDNAQFWDPLTGTNLTRSHPVSADLTAFSSPQLANISNAVTNGVLTLVSGTLPAGNAIYAEYGLYVKPGSAGAPIGGGVTGVAANEF